MGFYGGNAAGPAARHLLRDQLPRQPTVQCLQQRGKFDVKSHTPTPTTCHGKPHGK